jgi:alpha-1,2-mannosyltransferase
VDGSGDTQAKGSDGPHRGSPYLVAGTVAAVLALVAYLAAFGTTFGLDLHVYLDGARSWAHGRDPYALAFTPSHLPFTYPPFALPVMAPLTWIPFAAAQWTTWALSVAACTASVVCMVAGPGRRRDGWLWAASLTWVCAAVLLLEPVRSGMDYGQVEPVLMFLVVADLMVARPPASGLVVGLASALKLTPLVFVVAFALRRDWWAAVRSVVTFAAVTGAAWIAWPHLSHTFWLHDVSQPGRTGPVAYPGNLSWYAVVHRSPFPATGSPAAWALLCVATLAVGLYASWRCAATGRLAWSVVAVAFTGLLISPISWSHHWVWVLLLPPMLVTGVRTGVARPVRVLLWGVVVLAVAAPYWWVDSGPVADGFQALVPVWTFATLVVWSVAEHRAAGAGDPNAGAGAGAAAVAPGPDPERAGHGR